jgi:hypothetical protein
MLDAWAAAATLGVGEYIEGMGVEVGGGDGRWWGPKTSIDNGYPA